MAFRRTSSRAQAKVEIVARAVARLSPPFRNQQPASRLRADVLVELVPAPCRSSTKPPYPGQGLAAGLARARVVRAVFVAFLCRLRPENFDLLVLFFFPLFYSLPSTTTSRPFSFPIFFRFPPFYSVLSFFISTLWRGRAVHRLVSASAPSGPPLHLAPFVEPPRDPWDGPALYRSPLRCFISFTVRSSGGPQRRRGLARPGARPLSPRQIRLAVSLRPSHRFCRNRTVLPARYSCSVCAAAVGPGCRFVDLASCFLIPSPMSICRLASSPSEKIAPARIACYATCRSRTPPL